MADEIRNVFISHIHEDDEGLAKLKDLLGKSGFVVRDASYYVNFALAERIPGPRHARDTASIRSGSPFADQRVTR